VGVATARAFKVEELARSLEKYDVEACMVPRSCLESNHTLVQALRERGDTYWTKAIFSEHMRLYRLGPEGLEGFKARLEGCLRPDGELREGVPRNERGLISEDELSNVELLDCLPVVAYSQLEVWQLPKSEQALVRENKLHLQAMALHTHPMATGERHNPDDGPLPGAEEPIVEKKIYRSFVEGYIDLSRRSTPDGVVGWDDIFVLAVTGMTYQEMKERGLKISPRDINVNQYIIEQLYYASRKATNFINAESSKFDRTVSFEERFSVGAFVESNEHMNNRIAALSGLRDVFRAVANNGAFFRSAHTRREVNYWLPGLNAGIPFVQKKDPIHEITFTAHDFGHFLIPDLVYTGNNSTNARRTYILYRMMSEATTMVFADMLFVDSLKLAGYEYDWTKRRIHPLLEDTGQSPFGGLREGGDLRGPAARATFFSAFRKLLEANVDYCLLGQSDLYTELIQAHRGPDFLQDGTCPSLEAFKQRYMPFFVEDYRWTSKNFENMSKTPEVYQRWWALAEPLRRAAGLDRMSGGIGLETVDDHMHSIGVDDATDISVKDLIARIFERMFQTRIVPIFERGEEFPLAPPSERLKNAFVRYLLGQMIVFARFDFVLESRIYATKIVDFVAHEIDRLTLEKVECVRSYYGQFLRILQSRSLLTPDDYENFQEICPLFEPVYVFYDESEVFYKRLAEVQQEILAA